MQIPPFQNHYQTPTRPTRFSPLSTGPCKATQAQAGNPIRPPPLPPTQVVFLHRPTGTLIVTDVFWNYPEAVPFGTRAWKFGMDRVRPNPPSESVASDPKLSPGGNRDCWRPLLPPFRDPVGPWQIA